MKHTDLPKKLLTTCRRTNRAMSGSCSAEIQSVGVTRSALEHIDLWPEARGLAQRQSGLKQVHEWTRSSIEGELGTL